jgi:N-acetylneuraminate synthase
MRIIDVLNTKETTACYFIAEIGINHNGDISIAQQMIDQAVISGANAVKFQKRDINLVYSQEYLNEPRQSFYGNTQRALKEGLEFSLEQYRYLMDYSHARNIDFIASVWDEVSAQEMADINIDCIKIAAPCLTDIKLLHKINSLGIPCIISFGMCDLDQAMATYARLDRIKKIVLHCVSSYPADDKDINLNRIQTIYKEFPDAVRFGYSGHEKDCLASVGAFFCGARVIERHVTLDKTLWGSDQKISIMFDEFAEMVQQIRRAELLLGSSSMVVLQSEMPFLKKLKRHHCIETVFIDIDGVITDSHCSIDSNLVEKKIYNYKDLDAITRFKSKGYQVIVYSKESTQVNKAIAEILKPTKIFLGVSDKKRTVEQYVRENNISLENVACIGDSYNDLPSLKTFKYSFCPNDAIEEVKKCCLVTLKTNSGEGCLAELLGILELINGGGYVV